MYISVMILIFAVNTYAICVHRRTNQTVRQLGTTVGSQTARSGKLEQALEQAGNS